MNIFNTILIQPLANGLIIFYRILFGNMGLAIIAFSLALVTALRPMTKQYMDSMKKMKEYQPQLDKLKKKYKNDKQGLMKAQADFYKQKGINPGAGCLPMILQLVVLFSLLQVFLKALTGSDPTKLNLLLYEPLKFHAGEIINTRFLYMNITKPDTFNIPGIPFGIPGPILILAALSQMISAKITGPYLSAQEKAAKKTPGAGDDFQSAMQSSAVYTFPLMTLLIGGRFPSGIALYWFFFSLYQAYQQYRSTGIGGLKSWVEKIEPVLKALHIKV
jgi:YidC/Oxa1 family membrane protein insertase